LISTNAQATIVVVRVSTTPAAPRLVSKRITRRVGNPFQLQ